MLKKETYNLLGCPCISIDSVDTANELLTEAVTSGVYGYSVAINAEKIMRNKSDAQLCEAIEQSSFPFSDGAGAVIALRYLHGIRSVKLDLPKTALNLANTNGWKLFVVGSHEEVNRTACDAIKRLYPNIQLIGRLNGFESEETILHAIETASPQLVFLGLGSPKQELLAHKMRNMLVPTFMIGCGGALDVLAGKARRAPSFMINNNLEWLYRLYKQPSRLKRQFKLVNFLACLITEKFSSRQSDIYKPSIPGRYRLNPR
jgi:N-acetylglucosaminyldiphosphoundecaprenol N-acetyl-beta-D-mannosaminyltransferase